LTGKCCIRRETPTVSLRAQREVLDADKARHDSCEGDVARKVRQTVGYNRYVLTLAKHSKGADMDKDRIEGAAKQAKGSVKEAMGKAVGDAKTEAEGKADKAEGRVQNAIGGMKDAARQASDKIAGKE
jgi:uncharacterized protein YjbJ (UPF0337 family)